MARKHKDTKKRRTGENGDVALCPHFQFQTILKMGTPGYVPVFLIRGIEYEFRSYRICCPNGGW